MWWLALYLIGAFLMGRSFVRFSGKSEEWNLDDSFELGLLSLLAVLVAVLWPLSLAAGLLMAVVRRGADRV